MAIQWDERLQNAVTSQSPLPYSVLSSSEPPHARWPRRADHGGLEFKQIEQYLANHKGTACEIRKLVFNRASADEHPKWRPCEPFPHASNTEELRATIDAPRGELGGDATEMSIFAELYLVSVMDSEPMQMLGHYLNVDPRFFNIPWSGNMRTGQARADCMHWGLPFMDQLDKDKNRKKLENGDVVTRKLGDGRFKTVRQNSGWGTDENERASSEEVMPKWHQTRVNACISQRRVDGRDIPVGIIVFDWYDIAISKAVETFGGRFNERPESYLENETRFQGGAERNERNVMVGKIALSNIMAELLYIVQVTWSAFLKDAQKVLNDMDKECIDRPSEPGRLIELTTSLHTIRIKLGEAHRRMLLTKELIEYMQKHAWFSDVKQYYEPWNMYSSQSMDRNASDRMECEQLITQASTLTSLIYNINAIEEGKRSNILASSARRVADLTFIYLPLMLVASILGMNVTEIVTDSQSTISIRVFFAVAFPLMALTFVVWRVWSTFAGLWESSRSTGHESRAMSADGQKS